MGRANGVTREVSGAAGAAVRLRPKGSCSIPNGHCYFGLRSQVAGFSAF